MFRGHSVKRVTSPLLGGSVFQRKTIKSSMTLTTALERILLNGFKGLWINTISVMAGDSPLSNCVKLTEF